MYTGIRTERGIVGGRFSREISSVKFHDSLRYGAMVVARACNKEVFHLVTGPDRFRIAEGSILVTRRLFRRLLRALYTDVP